MAAKCPHCEKLLTCLRFDGVTANQSGGPNTLNTLIYSCPFCFCAVGAEVDPIALKHAIVADVTKALRTLGQQLANNLLAHDQRTLCREIWQAACCSGEYATNSGQNWTVNCGQV